MNQSKPDELAAREAAILQALFGSEGIPFKVMDVLSEIRAHISAIIALCDHQPMPLRSGQMLNRDPAQSQALNLRIAQLWETPKADGRRRTWPEVAAVVGSGMVASSARNRYQRYQAQLADKMKTGADAPVEPLPKAQEPEQDMDALKAKIMQLREGGMDTKVISEQLAPENVAPVHKETKAPAPKPISRAELDAKIWGYWDHGKGKTPAEISDLLCAEGYYYGETSVRTRLLQQGAKL